MLSKKALPLLLVVDDDPFFLKHVEFSAKSMYRVIAARSVEEVDRSTLDGLHVLVLDLNIPGSNTIEFMQSFQDMAHQLHLLIISGLVEKTVKFTATVAKSLHFASVDVLQKPFNNNILGNLLKSLSCSEDSVSRISATRTEETKVTITDLKTALAKKEFVTYFQPQLDDNGDFHGAEALIRWQHPDKGLLPPASFIELLETPELALPFTLYVAEDAVRQFQMIDPALRNNGKLSINVPHSALAEPHLANQLCDILQKYAFEPSNFVVEVTERGIPDCAYKHANTIAMLRIKGIEISIDDFGTGSSGLETLKVLAVDEIKIDKLFIDDVCKSTTSQLLVLTIMRMAKALDLRVVIEGIETWDAMQWLCAEGGFIAQGYLFSKPISGHELSRYLQTLNRKRIKLCGERVGQPYTGARTSPQLQADRPPLAHSPHPADAMRADGS